VTQRAASIDAGSLKRVACRLLVAAGLLEEHAQTVAEVLVWADLRGVPSHGVGRLPRYLELVKSGEMNPRPAMHYVSERPLISVLEADRAAGPVAMSFAMAETVRKSRTSGASITLVRATTHTAALGFYTRRAASEGALAIAFAGSTPNMLYHGARRAGVSTSPMSIASPGGDGSPIVFDMGTAAISVGKLARLAQSGEAVPANSAADKDGVRTTDPSRAVTPLPIAGAKGSGLSLMIEILTSILASNPILADALEATGNGKKHRQNALVMAIDVASLCDMTHFVEEVRRLARVIRSLPPEDAEAGVLLPGERGDRAYQRNQANGISLSPRTMQDLERLAAEHGVIFDRGTADS
jgi:LDH2 family malate/lactate/ureidoglycolate dehydrogenase